MPPFDATIPSSNPARFRLPPDAVMAHTLIVAPQVLPDVQTFRDLADYIGTDVRLEPKRRIAIQRDMLSFMKAVPVAAVQPPIGKSLNHLFKQLRRPNSGYDRKRADNIISNCRAALKWYYSANRGATKEIRTYSTEWEKLKKLIPEHGASDYLRRHLSRFMHFCTINNILPERVDASVLDGYGDYIEQLAIAHRRREHQGYVVKGWNLAQASVPGWPSQILKMPDGNRRGVPLDAFSPEFRADMQRWAEVVSTQVDEDKIDENEATATLRRSLRADTIESRCYIFRRAALILAAMREVDVSAIKGLKELIAPGVPTEIVKCYRAELAEKQGLQGRRAPSIFNLVVALEAMAKRLYPEDTATHARLRNLKLQLPRPTQEISQDHLDLLLSLTDEDVAIIHRLPDQLRAEVTAKLGKMGRLSMQTVADAQVAVGVAILISAPIRIKNLAMILIGTHLKVDGEGMCLSFTAAETKGKRDLKMWLGSRAMEVIRWYCADVLPRIGNRPEPTALFPGRKSARTSDGFGKLISKHMSGVLNRNFHVHVFRHYAVDRWLEANPGRMEDAQALLDHKDQKTTATHYAGANKARRKRTMGSELEDMGEKTAARVEAAAGICRRSRKPKTPKA
jgi:integrase